MRSEHCKLTTLFKLLGYQTSIPYKHPCADVRRASANRQTLKFWSRAEADDRHWTICSVLYYLNLNSKLQNYLSEIEVAK